MFLAFGVNTPFTEIITGTTELYNSSSGLFLGILPSGLAIAGIVTAIGAISILAGSAAIPVILGLFVGIVVLPLFTFPVALINSGGMPYEFQLLGSSIFLILQFLFIISVVSYAKGSGD